MHTHKTESPSGTSYEMICATERKAPSVLYLLFELQPAIIIPITSNETNASKKNRPDSIPAPDHEGESGITEKPVNTAAKIRMGASLKRKASARVGTISSF